ncbi:MAG: lasso peptide biosynthesis B2 protein [Brevundimonas diminuta]|nr:MULTISPECIES: lasso peptide biosynthesis B2 protein [Brevundimonas]MBI2249107.1 lasso peptide biosynthesis B2 protein [Brevundimonas diminuta]OMG60723.1 hypothetical protein BJP32_01485 [Brevundimonas sp. ZS04]WQE46459.1 lasso peptide biosynthesis B2 protein [Brevundimonas diminuta]
MSIALADNVTFCRCSGQTVFLDENRDRYFRLRPQAEFAFSEWLASPMAISSELASLVDTGVLVRTNQTASEVRPVMVEQPSRSIVEPRTSRGFFNRHVLEVAATVWHVSRRMKSTSFHDLLETYRRRRQQISETAPSRTNIVELASNFDHALRLVPVEPTCLRDSLALLDFIHRRGLGADLVLGVKLDPFAAHCWVQSGDLLLNEASDHAAMFTPICVV